MLQDLLHPDIHQSAPRAARVTSDNFLASRQRQFNKATTYSKRAWGTKTNMNNVKVSVSNWSSHDKIGHNAITNKLVAWKHGHVVAAVFTRAQLWKKEWHMQYYIWHLMNYLTFFPGCDISIKFVSLGREYDVSHASTPDKKFVILNYNNILTSPQLALASFLLPAS